MSSPDMAQQEASPPGDQPRDEPPPPLDGEFSPQDAERLHHEGEAMLEQGDLEGALSRFLQAIDANPRYIPAYIAAADTFLGLGQPMEAADILQAGMENNPRQTNLRMFLAFQQMETGRFPEARRILEGVLRIEPGNAMAYVGLARIGIMEGNLDAAEAHLAEARQLDPDLPEIRVVEAQFLWRQGDKRVAIEILRDVARDPHLSEPVREELRRLFEEYGEQLPPPSE